nr:ABC transporter ATP-binding protein [Alkalicoccobacillus gibsonii]
MGIFVFLKKYKAMVGISIVLVLMELSVELFHPYLLARMIDDGVMQGDMETVVFWGIIMMGLTLLAFGAGVLNSFFATHAGQSTGYDIREQVYKRIQYSSFDRLKQFATSSLIMRLTNDVTQIQNSIVMTLRYMLRPPLVIVGALTMALIINYRLALVLVVVIPIVILLVGWVFKKGANQFKLVQTKLDGVNHVMRENLLGFKLVKAFVRRTTEASRFLNVNKSLRDKLISSLRLIELTQPMLLLLMNGSILLILWFGSESIPTGAISVGDVVAVVNYVLRISAALSSIPLVIMTFSRAKASSERLTEVLNSLEEEKTDEDQAISKQMKGSIQFQDVTFSYEEKEVPDLEEISFQVQSGQRVAIMGATGSGKSALFQLIPRLYRPKSGEIRIDEQPLESFNVIHMRRQISYVAQETFLFSGSIRDNICWGKPDATDEEMIQAAKDAQIHDVIMTLPNQYDAAVSQRGSNLSGGQKQRIAIARALIRNPRILLLDDSTSALDTKTEQRFLHALKQYECTTLMITQKVSTAMTSDYIVIIDQGRIVAQGSHQESKKKSKFYQAMLASQQKDAI